MLDDSIGFQDDPRNGFQVKRSRTSENVRAWEFPRSLGVIDVLKSELGNVPFPAIYMLFERGDRVYIGEAGNIINRLKQHIQNPSGNVEQVQNWDRAIIINDGRPANQSDINDVVIRRSLEKYLKDLLRDNGYEVVSQASTQQLTAIQRNYMKSYRKEIDVLLMKTGVIHKLLDDIEIRKVYLDELEQILLERDFDIQEINSLEARIDGEKYYIRTGSEKSRGFQVTFRGRTLDALKDGRHNLLMDRDGILMIPLNEIKGFLPDDAFEDKVTLDIFIRFDENRAKLVYHDMELDVTEYILIQSDHNNRIREIDPSIELYDVSLSKRNDDEGEEL